MKLSAQVRDVYKKQKDLKIEVDNLSTKREEDYQRVDFQHHEINTRVDKVIKEAGVEKDRTDSIIEGNNTRSEKWKRTIDKIKIQILSSTDELRRDFMKD